MAYYKDITNGSAAGVADCVPVEQEKHIRLVGSIAKIDDVINRSKSLLDRVSGVPTEKVDGYDVCKNPTLIGVLSDAPLLIDQKCQEVIDILNQLESDLF